MNILIVGKNSYIGNNIDKWLTSRGHKVYQLDVLNENWELVDYSLYQAIIHVAGIVHRPQCKDWQLYKSVNCDLPIKIATQAKKQGVKLYVYLSTMGVYNVDKRLIPTIVNINTPLTSTGLYGKSKLMGEKGLNKLQDANFRIAIVRPPSVYGKNCKGGYISGFTRIARILPVIPKAYNDVHQSFIYIDNLCECIRFIVENNKDGIFCPQDDQIPNANELLEAITIGLGKHYHENRVLGYFMKLFKSVPLVKKAYGGIEYSRQLSDIADFNYVIVPFKEGIKRTVETQ